MRQLVAKMAGANVPDATSYLKKAPHPPLSANLLLSFIMKLTSGRVPAPSSDRGLPGTHDRHAHSSIPSSELQARRLAWPLWETRYNCRMIKRRAVLAAASLPLAKIGRADSFPNGPLRIIAAFGPGSATDTGGCGHAVRRSQPMAAARRP